MEIFLKKEFLQYTGRLVARVIQYLIRIVLVLFVFLIRVHQK